MNLRSLCEAHNHLPVFFFLILLSIGCFNSFFIIKPVSIFFQISSLIGEVLVNKFITFCNYILQGIRLTYLFLQVLYEDALIFLKDAVETFGFFIYSLQNFYLFLENLIQKFYQLAEAFFSVFGFFYHTLAAFKEAIVLLGLTIWNYFTVLPEAVTFTINGFNNFIVNTVNEFNNAVFELQVKAIESLKKTYLFLFDIPLNSVYGLIIGAVLLTILYVKFKNICIFVTSVILKLYQQFISFGISLWNGRFLEKRSRRTVRSNSFENDERLCIVCQHKLKEIILFPCKHLCLCSDCCSFLIKTRPSCPMCRSDIAEILKVYV